MTENNTAATPVAQNNTLYVEMKKEFNGKSYRGKSKDGTNYLLIQAKEEKYQQDGTVYWLLGYTSEEKYQQKLAGERVDADIITAIKERKGQTGDPWYSGAIFDNKNKTAHYINLYQPREQKEGVDLLLAFKPTEYKEYKPKAQTLDTPF